VSPLSSNRSSIADELRENIVVASDSLSDIRRDLARLK
jgi:hypothetical protein